MRRIGAWLTAIALGCGGEPVPSAPEPPASAAPLATRATAGDEAPPAAEPEAPASAEPRLAADDDAVHGWGSERRHDEALRALTKVLEDGVELLDPVEAERLRAEAAAVLERAAAAARREATGSGEHPLLRWYAHEIRRVGEGEVSLPSLANTEGDDPWVVVTPLADGTVRRLLPRILRGAGASAEARMLRRLRPIEGDSDAEEAALVAAVDALAPMLASLGLPPHREFAEASVPNVVWYAYDGLMLARFASARPLEQGDPDRIVEPESAAGWCTYARFLAYEIWSEVAEETFWIGEGIDGRLAALSQGGAGGDADDVGPGARPGARTREEVEALAALDRELAPIAHAIRAAVVHAPATELPARASDAATRLPALAPVMANDAVWCEAVAIAERRAHTVASLCGAGTTR